MYGLGTLGTEVFDVEGEVKAEVLKKRFVTLMASRMARISNGCV